MLSQLKQRGESIDAAGARVGPFLLDLPVLEAVFLQLRPLLKRFDTAAALVRPLLRMSPQVVFKGSQLQEDIVAVWTSGFSSVMDHQVSLIVRDFEEVFVTHGAVILLSLVALFMLLQRILHLELLPAGAAGVNFVMKHHVSLEFSRAVEGFAAFWTRPAVFFGVHLQMFVEVFWEQEVLLAVRACVKISVRSFAMAHYVSF